MTATDLRLRVASPVDGAALAAIYAPVVRETVISFELEPPDADEMARRVERTLPNHPWLVAESDGDVVGYAYATSFRARAAYRFTAEVSTYIGARARRRGVARRLNVALLELLELQRVHSVIAGVTLPNEASVALHESLGFEPVGVYREVGFKFGTWCDVGFWSRPLVREPDGDHRPFRELESAEIERVLG